MKAANTMFYKVVVQRAGDYAVLCGFNTKLVFATAERITSAATTLTLEQAMEIAYKHGEDLNAGEVVDITAASVYKKLEGADMRNLVDKAEKTFAEMGIAQYM